MERDGFIFGSGQYTDEDIKLGHKIIDMYYKNDCTMSRSIINAIRNS